MKQEEVERSNSTAKLKIKDNVEKSRSKSKCVTVYQQAYTRNSIPFVRKTNTVYVTYLIYKMASNRYHFPYEDEKKNVPNNK